MKDKPLNHPVSADERGKPLGHSVSADWVAQWVILYKQTK